MPSTTSHETNSMYFFSKILSKFEFEVNFSVQSCASLTREDPVYLQIIYHYLYYLKYTELKNLGGGGSSLGGQTNMPAFKSLWIHL